MALTKILAIEDERDILQMLVYNLTREGYEVKDVTRGELGLRYARQYQPDVILLDLMLPDMDGVEVCRHLKRDDKTAHIPVIMVTAKGDEADIVSGLELGADDYIPKPFSPKVLIARIRAVLRRQERTPLDPDDEAPVRQGALCIHPGKHFVEVDGEEVSLTQTEFRILLTLMRQAGWVFTRAQLVSVVHGDEYAITERAIDVQIVNLRKKLGDIGESIQTVRGVGYRFRELS